MKRVDPPVLASLLSAIARANEELATINVFAGGDHIDQHPHPERDSDPDRHFTVSARLR